MPENAIGSALPSSLKRTPKREIPRTGKTSKRPMAFGLILSVASSLLVLQGTVTSILDNFVVQWLATTIGGFFAIVFVITLVFTIVYVQAKVPI